MRILLKDTYKSLEPFESEELSNFAVITGKNGSGKSQLFDLIVKKAQNDKAVLGIDLNFAPLLSKVQMEGIVKPETIAFNSQKWKEILNNKFQRYNSFGVAGKNLIDFIIKNKKTFLEQQSRDKLYTDDPDYINLLQRFSATITNPRGFTPAQNIGPNDEKQILNQLRVSDWKFFDLIEQIAKQSNKEIKDLAQSDFYSSSISEAYVDQSDLFNSQIELIFYNYAKRRKSNKYNYFLQKEEGISNGAIPDSEFLKENLPPWDIINQILESHKIDFYFRAINIATFDIDADLDFQLIKRSSGKNIPFADLSSGEKTIVGLVLKLFTTEYYGSSLSFPGIILLDEPDGYLHPEMSKLLIDVLGETFVNKFNIKVIITTHSPSTIALCPENSIYQLTNGTNTSLKGISKDDALKLLTDFIPTLSIDYKSHRQVFVESPTDISYFQNLSDKHQQSIKLAHKLYFIANSYGKGNCSEVYKIVDEVRKSGNTTIYGIVDWDTQNKPNEHVLVHGLNTRYSIENYLLDPIYVIILLIDLNGAHGILESLGLDNTVNQYSLGDKTNSELQKFIEQFFKDFEAKFPAFKYQSDQIEINYLNHRKLKIPTWYLIEQGHGLVDKLKQVYPVLSTKYTNEAAMLKQLSIVAAKCYPFVASDTIAVIEELGVKM